MDARQERGLVIAALCKVNKLRDTWLVPSQTTGDRIYRVDPQQQTCTCPDHQEAGHKCKHLYAVEFVIQRELFPDGTVCETRSLTFTERKTYKQDWPAYNRAQATEKYRFQELLYDLCRNIAEPEKTGKGRFPHTHKNSVFAMVFKVYSTFSSRRFGTDLSEAHRQGFLTKQIPGLKINHFMENPAFTPILKQLIARSALPLRTIEKDFAIDSSGFSTNKFERWYDKKYGVTRRRCTWVKTHIACGVKTNVITAVRILDKDAADSPQFTPLVKDTSVQFTIGEVSADKAYASLDNFETVAECGGTGFMAFKENTTGAIGGLFEKMFHYFQFKKDEYYGQVSQAFKRGIHIQHGQTKVWRRCSPKNEVAMVNEVLCKLLAHNLCVLIQEEQELGIQAEFRPEKKPVMQLAGA